MTESNPLDNNRMYVHDNLKPTVDVSRTVLVDSKAVTEPRKVSHSDRFRVLRRDSA
jgi:hypothetical protein